MTKIKTITQTAFALSAGLLLSACANTRYDEPAYSSSAYYESDYDSGGQYSTGTSAQFSSDAEYSSATGQSSISEASGAQNIENEIVIPLHEERINVGKRTVDAGEVIIRKIVTTETINQPIQLRRETLVIDRGEGQQGASFSSSPQTGSPRTQELDAEYQRNAAIANEPSGALRTKSQTENSAASSSGSGSAFQEQAYTIRLQEERPVIEKTIVQTGRVTAQKQSRTQQQNISQQVRREDVQLDRSNAQNVEIRGNFRSAGQPLTDPAGAQPQQDEEKLNQQNNQTQPLPQSDDRNQQDSSDTP